MIWVWVALVVALLAMLAVFAVVLFRKLIALLQEFSDLVGRTAILDGVHRAEPEPRPLPAVLQPRAIAAAAHAASVRGRSERARARRGARLARARALIAVNASTRTWFSS